VGETRVWVTGATGFVGRHLRQFVTAQGDFDVTGDERCDVTDVAALQHALHVAQPTVIYHLAAQSSVARSWRDPAAFTLVNVVGTRRVLEVARAVVPHARVVVVSSAEVYGAVDPALLPVTEHAAVSPTNPYATSKLEAEYVAHEAVRRYGQDVVIARPFPHVGPGQSAQFVLPAIIGRLLDARASAASSIAVGNLSVRRDLCDVRDVVRAYWLLARYGVTGATYNVATERDHELGTLVAWVRDQLAPGCALTVDPTLLRPVDVPVLRGSFGALHEVTGWEPVIPIEDSLRDIIADQVKQRELGVATGQTRAD